jgi:hypothetical protein
MVVEVLVRANTYVEPVGGLMNLLLTGDGQHYQYPQIGDGRSLVIDLGGFTTDFLAVNQGGQVDYALARSVPLGIQSVIHDFEESFRANNLEIVKDTSVLPPNRVRKVVAAGYFVSSGHKYPYDIIETEDAGAIMMSETNQHLSTGPSILSEGVQV